MILVQKKSYRAIGEMFGITDNAIKKKAKSLGIELPQRRKININENFSHKQTGKPSLVNSINDEQFIEIINNSTSWVEIGKKLGYKGKSFNMHIKKLVKERCSKLGIECVISETSDVHSETKKGLFVKRKNWQSARSAIQRDARNVYFSIHKNPSCLFCGYQNHIEVAHIKAVSEFDDDVLISEINSSDNLIGLCPNHHWEFDHGILKL